MALRASYEDRKQARITDGDGWTRVSDSESLARFQDVVLELPAVSLRRDWRIVEPGALVLATATRRALLENVPQAKFNVFPHMDPRQRLAVVFAVTFTGGSFLLSGGTGSFVGGAGAPEPGFWSGVLRSIGLSTRASEKIETPTGADLWAALDQARKQGFSDDEIAEAFGEIPAAVDQLRAAGLEVMRAAIERKPARGRLEVFERAAKDPKFNGFDERDLARPLAEPMFFETLADNVNRADVARLFELAELVK